MKEYCIYYVVSGREEVLIALPSFWKVLCWFLRTAWRCDRIVLYRYPVSQEEKDEGT